MIQRAGNGGNRQFQGFRRCSNANEWVPLHEFLDAQRRRSRPPQLLYLLSVVGKKVQSPFRCVRCLLSGRCYSVEKKCQPLLPGALGANSLQQVVVLASIRLEIETGIQKWLCQHIFGTQQECDEQSPHPSIAVQKRVNRFELDVYESSFDQKREFVLLVVEKSLQAAQTFHELLGRRWDKGSVPRPCAPDPVLRPAKFTWTFVGAPSTPEQNFMDLANQTERERETSRKPSQPMLHRGDVVGNFLNVLNGHFRGCFVLKQQEIRKRRLCAFDLRREQRLLADVQIE